MTTHLSKRLAQQSALVTGSTNGIGVAIARALADEGAHVIVSGRDSESGKRVAASIAEAGGRADFVAADLAGGRPAIAALAAAATAAAGGQLDVLVNNAAQLVMPAPTGEVDEDLIDQVLAVNVKAAFLLTGMIATAMADRGTGAVVNVGSINGLVGMAGSALYSTSKAALHSLTKSWAAEYGPAGVRVNTVAPGPTLTERTAMFGDRIAPIVAAMPSRRLNTPAEVAAAVVFLASDDAANIHGATLSVDGGRAAV